MSRSVTDIPVGLCTLGDVAQTWSGSKMFHYGSDGQYLQPLNLRNMQTQWNLELLMLFVLVKICVVADIKIRASRFAPSPSYCMQLINLNCAERLPTVWSTGCASQQNHNQM